MAMDRRSWHGQLDGRKRGRGRLGHESDLDPVLRPCPEQLYAAGMARPELAESGTISEPRSYNSPILGVRGCSMKLRSKISLQAVLFLLVAVSAHAVKNNNNLRITVLDSETHSIGLADSGVPKNCDQVNYDAYCNSSKTALVTNTLLVQQDDGNTFHVSCTIDSKWSRCMPLPKGESFDAKKEKRGLLVYFEDDKGKLRSQLYTYVAGETQDSIVEPAAARQAEASAPAPTAAPASPAATAPASLQDRVKCSFSSTPAGADITLDGHYVGSTPSRLALSAGSHAVVISAPGFAPWKRELTVSSGSDLTVNAVLEKAQ